MINELKIRAMTAGKAHVATTWFPAAPHLAKSFEALVSQTRRLETRPCGGILHPSPKGAAPAKREPYII